MAPVSAVEREGALRLSVIWFGPVSIWLELRIHMLLPHLLVGHMSLQGQSGVWDAFEAVWDQAMSTHLSRLSELSLKRCVFVNLRDYSVSSSTCLDSLQ